MNIATTSGIFLLVTASLGWTAGAVAASPELVDFSCPATIGDEPTLFPEAAVPLEETGILHLKDHGRSYKVTFTPAFDARQGYIGDLVILGRSFTRDPVSQAKTYIFNKDEFQQEVVDFPITFCRSNKAPYQRHGVPTLGQLTVEDDSGGSISSQVKLAKVYGCSLHGICAEQGLGVLYDDQEIQPGTNSANIELGRGILNQDVRILPPQSLQ